MKRVVPVVCVAALPIAFLIYFCVSRFVVYQGDVDRVVATVPPEETLVSPQALDVFEKLDGTLMSWIVSRNIVFDVTPTRVRIVEGHLRGALWAKLLPVRLGHRKILRLYLHYMVFEHGQGIEYGARTYFQKSVGELTSDDAIALFVISRNPTGSSPSERRSAFEQQVKFWKARYRAVA